MRTRSDDRPTDPHDHDGPPGARARWRTAAWLAYSACLGLLYAHLPTNPDQSIFDYIAWVCAEGGVPYRDAGDENFPGPIALHTLARLAFGDAPWAFRALDYLALVGFCLAARAALIRRGEGAVAAVFVPLYQAMYVTGGFWFSGQRDILAGHLTLLAGLAYLGRLGGGGPGWLAGVGACAWAAAMIKPTYATCLPALALVDLALRGRPRGGLARVAADQALAVGVAVALTGLLAGLARWAGALVPWYENAILLNTEYYAGQTPGPWFLVRALATIVLGSWRWYAAAAAAGFVLWWRSGDRPSLLVVLALIGVATISVLAQAKGFAYHFGGFYPAIGLLAAAALARLLAAARDPGKSPRARIALAAPLALAVLLLASKVDREYRRQVAWQLGLMTTGDFLAIYQLRAAEEVGDFIRNRSNPDDTVLVYSDNFDLRINLTAKRRTPVRFIPSMLIDMGAPPFSRAGRWLAEWDEALRLRPPRFIVVVEAGDGPETRPTERSPGRRSLEATIADHYRVVTTATNPGGGRYFCFERVE